MKNIEANLHHIHDLLPDSVTLVCVSKYHTEQEIMQAYNCGERHFAESRVGELTLKYQHLPKDIKWHFIGHLQTNKVKQLLPMAYLIHSVDSQHLLASIDKHAAALNVKPRLLLEAHIAQEEHKFGFTPSQLISDIEQLNTYQHVAIEGLMGMATNTDNEKQIESEFARLKELFDNIHAHNPNFQILSMGMTGDYHLALRHGTTLVRIGSGIFGE